MLLSFGGWNTPKMVFHAKIAYRGKRLLLLFPYKWKINPNGQEDILTLLLLLFLFFKGKQKKQNKTKMASKTSSVSVFWHLPKCLQ